MYTYFGFLGLLEGKPQGTAFLWVFLPPNSLYGVSMVWDIVSQSLKKGRGRELTFAACLPWARHCASTLTYIAGFIVSIK